jgi:hypothetical protein
MDQSERPQRPSLRSERGLMLIELLTVLPMLVIILLGTYALYTVGARSQRDTTGRVQTLLQQRNGLEQLSREMRQAMSVTPVSSQVLEGTTWVRPSDGGPSAQRRVRYDCTGGACNRWEGPPGGGFTSGPEMTIADVQNADVFVLMPNTVNPAYVGVKVEVGVRGASNPITLDGGFALRNVQDGT